MRRCVDMRRRWSTVRPKSRTRRSTRAAPSTGGDGTCEGPCRISGGRWRSLKASQTSVATSCELAIAGTITLFWAAMTARTWFFSLAISRTTVCWLSSPASTTVQTSGRSFTGPAKVCSTAIWSMMLPLAMATSFLRAIRVPEAGSGSKRKRPRQLLDRPRVPGLSSARLHERRLRREALMQCPRCQHANPPRAEFCEQCGARLGRTCTNCGSPLARSVKFCPECGRAVAESESFPPRLASPEAYTPKHLAEKILISRSALEGERKRVTVLFADLRASLELLAARDPEDARRLLDPLLERMMEAVHRYEGTVNQVMGDGIMALFGAPLAHEDHAVRACYAALRMQESVKRY